MRTPTPRSLTGSRCQCGACGEHFNSTAAFDMHRTGDYGQRRCLTPTEMRAAGMVLSATDWWITKPFEDAVSSHAQPPRSASGGDGAT